MPGHTGIRYNERADEAAKAALSPTVSTMAHEASHSEPFPSPHTNYSSLAFCLTFPFSL